jgi:hypothetical protein
MSSYHDGSRKADAMSGADTEGKEHRKSDILASERICVADFRLQSQLMPLSTSQSKLSEYFSSRKVWRLYSWDGVRLPSMMTLQHFPMFFRSNCSPHRSLVSFAP